MSWQSPEDRFCFVKKGKVPLQKFHYCAILISSYNFEFQVAFLEKLGCEFASLILTPAGEVLQLGSNKGQHYLNANPDVDLRFREYFGKQKLMIYRMKLYMLTPN